MKLAQVMNQMNRAMQQYVKSPDVVYVLSVSMGVDSSVLLETFYQMKQNIHVVHFNHHQREQSEEEALFIKEYCKIRQIECTVIDVPKMKGNFQNRARQFRYQQLEAVASTYSNATIVTAHHQDDQIETYMQRIFSGSSFVKRQGMSMYEVRKSGSYFRPFIHMEKADLYAIAKTEQITYFEDDSNHENYYVRNQIRNQILPIIESVFPAYKRAIRKDIEEAKMLDAYFEAQFIAFEQRAIKQYDNWIEIEKDAFECEHIYMQMVILERCVGMLGFTLKRAHYQQVCERLSDIGKGYTLKEGLYCYIEETKLRIALQKDYVKTCEEYHFFVKDELVKLPKQYQMWYNEGNSGYDDFFECNQEDFPFLKVRNTRRGDRVQLGQHHKRVSRIFIDAKLPQLKRSSYPLIEDIRTNQIVWIPMMYKSYKRDKTKQITKIYFKNGGFHA